jgi:hypothetical protein
VELVIAGIGRLSTPENDVRLRRWRDATPKTQRIFTCSILTHPGLWRTLVGVASHPRHVFASVYKQSTPAALRPRNATPLRVGVVRRRLLTAPFTFLLPPRTIPCGTKLNETWHGPSAKPSRTRRRGRLRAAVVRVLLDSSSLLLPKIPSRHPRRLSGMGHQTAPDPSRLRKARRTT